MNEWMHTLKFSCVPDVCYLTMVSCCFWKLLRREFILLSHVAEVQRATWPLAIPPGFTLQAVQPSTDLTLVQPPCAGPSRDGTISEDTIRASLISAVSDKLRWRMKEEMDRAQAELNALKRTEEDLKKGHQKLEEMVTRLDQEVVSERSHCSLLEYS